MKIYIALLLILVFASCTRKPSIEETDDHPIIINIPDSIDKFKFSKYSDFYDTVKLVRLETKENCLIGRIDKIISYKSNFFVLDQTQSKSVFQFDSAGKFVKEFGSRGDGPGKYNEPNDISIKNNELVVWVNDYKKFITYGLDGNFKKEVRSASYGKSGTTLGNGSYAIYLDIGADVDTEEKHNLQIISNEGKSIGYGFEKRDKAFSKGIFFFQQTGDHIFVSPGYSNNIYELKDIGLVKKIVVNMGKHSIPDDFYSKFNDALNFKNALNLSEYAYISEYFDTKDYVIFTLIFKGIGYDCYYSKKTKLFKYANNWFNDIYGFVAGGGNFSVEADYVVSVYDPAQIEGYQKAFSSPPTDEERQKLSESANNFFRSSEKKAVNYFTPKDFKHTTSEINFLKSVKVTDNPIVVLKKIKPF